MASTYTTRIRLEKQADGSNANTWGQKLNDNVIGLIDDAIAAYTTVSASSIDITLSNNDGSSDQARSAMLELQGTVSVNLNVIIPAVSKMYVINDKTTREAGTETITLKTASGAGIDVASGARGLYFCDSVSVHSPNATGMGLGTAADANLAVPASVSNAAVPPVSVADVRYVQASAGADVSITSGVIMTSIASFTGPVYQAPVTVTASATIPLDMSNSNSFTCSLGEDTVLENPSNVNIGATGSIYLIQDATGSRTCSYGDMWLFPGASAPTLSTSASAVDLLIYNVREVSAIDSVLIKEFG